MTSDNYEDDDASVEEEDWQVIERLQDIEHCVNIILNMTNDSNTLAGQIAEQSAQTALMVNIFDELHQRNIPISEYMESRLN